MFLTSIAMAETQLYLFAISIRTTQTEVQNLTRQYTIVLIALIRALLRRLTAVWLLEFADE